MATTFFNAAIQERRKYGAVGWNIPYQWMASDFAFAQQNLCLMLDEQPSTPFEVPRRRSQQQQRPQQQQQNLCLMLDGSSARTDTM